MSCDVVLGIPVTFTVLAVLAVALRFYVRTRTKAGLGWDDWTMLLAVAFDIATRGLATTFTIYWCRVPFTPQDAVGAAKYAYISLPTHLAVSVLARLSITILLIRLFGVHRWFRLSVFSLFCIIAVTSIAFIPVTFAQITPVQALWDPSVVITERWSPQVWPHYATVQQSLYTFSDFVLVVLPVMIIWNLQMPLHQKAGLVLVMALGLLTMVMSIMRTVWIVQFSSASSRTEDYDENAIMTLTLLEGDMVIILGCIPTLRSLLNHTFSAKSILHKIFTRSRPATRRQVGTSTVDQDVRISTGAYLDLELSTREVPPVSENGRVCSTNSHSRNNSEDYLVGKKPMRKAKRLSGSCGSTADV